MSTRPWRVVLVDSGPSPQDWPGLEFCRRFGDDAGDAAPVLDGFGHGTRIATILDEAQPRPRLSVAQVLGADGRCTAAAVARALAWAATLAPDLVHMSLGLAADRPEVAAAVAALVDAGIVCVASAPARGAAVYPAAYPGVIAATGDARCAPEEVSLLRPNVAEFGGRAVLTGGGREWRGASIGAAFVSRFIVSRLPAGASADAVRAALAASARYHGPERREATA